MIDSYQQLLLMVIPLLFAITVHEVAHGFAAYALGDPTAKNLGRLTLNPGPHIDPWGTLLMPALALMLSQGQMAFGFAKPVPFNPRHLKNPKRDTLLVIAAGPMSNFFMGLIWLYLLPLSTLLNDYPALAFTLAGMAEAGVRINIVFFCLNLLPVPPLDGYELLSQLLPYQKRDWLLFLEEHGWIVLLVLALTGALGWLLMPMARGILTIYGWLSW